MYSKQDLEYAAEFRETVHNEALKRVKAVYPETNEIIDRYPVESYFQKVWDYPGQWYTVVAVPEEAGSRDGLIYAIVSDTVKHCREQGKTYSEESFHKIIEEYPRSVIDYTLISRDNPETEKLNIFPYRGIESHRQALKYAAEKICAECECTCDINRAKCRKLSGKGLFAPVNSDEWLNYRKAFLEPPQGISYTDRDFERINEIIFPAGESVLEVYRWNTDWSEYFDDGHEWWGALCLSVYDRLLERFVIIMASATD